MILLRSSRFDLCDDIAKITLRSCAAVLDARAQCFWRSFTAVKRIKIIVLCSQGSEFSGGAKIRGEHQSRVEVGVVGGMRMCDVLMAVALLVSLENRVICSRNPLCHMHLLLLMLVQVGSRVTVCRTSIVLRSHVVVEVVNSYPVKRFPGHKVARLSRWSLLR